MSGAPFRGSRKHILDWVERPEFAAELEGLIVPSRARVVSNTWIPRDHRRSREAELETYGPRNLRGAIDWGALGDWWLAHKAGAKTPTWDLAAVCEVAGTRGIVLVEAKANVPELKDEAKRLETAASQRSEENHRQIARAIAEASNGLSQVVPGVRIDRDSHYQLSNRLAFAWKLASLGLPTVLVYLGFVGDDGIAGVGEPLKSDGHWREVFLAHAANVAPMELFDRHLDIEGTPLWVFIRSRAVLEVSPPDRGRRPSRHAKRRGRR